MIAIIAAAVLLYACVVALYAVNDSAVTVRGCDDAPPDDAILVSVSPESVDATSDRIRANLTVLSLGPVANDETGLADEALTVFLTGTDGAPSFTVAADEIPSPQAVRFITDGFVEQWPFDVHAASFAVVSVQDAQGDPRVIPTLLCGAVHVPGWTFTSDEVAGTEALVVDGEPVTQVRMIATRAPATVAFGIVLLVLMVVLPVLGLTVAIAAYRGRRKVEATLMSWMAAMLFAIIPLRTFLPGSPPVGSWVDFTVVLWVVAALVAGLVVYVLAWLRWSAPGPADAGVVAAASVVASEAGPPD